MPEQLLMNYLVTNDIYINPDIQGRASYPFTMEAAMEFFNHVATRSFDFPSEIGSIIIYDGKYNPPHGSYVAAHLHRESLDGLMQKSALPKPIGSLHIEFTGQGQGIRVTAKRLHL